MRLLLSLFLLSGSLWPAGAQSGIAVPRLGFAFDPVLGGIRPILGIAGAALLGSPLDSVPVLQSAAISPHQDFALAVSAEDGSVGIVRFPDTGTAMLPLPGDMNAPDRIVFSPAGSSALLLQQSSGRIQILTGLPGAPAIRELITAAKTAPAASAITDDGKLTVLAGAASDPSWALGTDGNFVPLALPESTMALAFRPGSHDLLAGTRDGNLYLARDVDTLPAFLRIDTGSVVASEPVAVRFSSDGATSYALGADGTIVAADLASGSTQIVYCRCKPTTLEPLRPDNMFRLTTISNLPLMLFEASSGLHVWFVPPDPAPVPSSTSDSLRKGGRRATASVAPRLPENQQ
jgi:WD40 repeat protein